jgi:hypothetical protein
MIAPLSPLAALYRKGRQAEAWRHSAAALRSGEDELVAANIIRLCSERLGELDAAADLLHDLEATRPEARGTLLLRMLLSSGNHEDTRLSSRTMHRLVETPFSLDEAELFFDISARTHDEGERAILALRLLKQLRALPEREHPRCILLVARIQVTLGAPRRALDALDKLSHLDGLATMTAWMARRMLDPRSANFLAPKVFCIGLSKTGTTSMMDALDILGFKSVHWTNKVTRNLIGVNDCLLFDAAGDITISHRCESLLHLFPNARFILTQRPNDSWEKSLLKHFRYLGKDFDEIRGRMLEPVRSKYGMPRKAALCELYAHYPTAVDAYRAFDGRVSHVFAHCPQRLLAFNLFTGDGWKELCGFLGVLPPGVPFPHRNRTAHLAATASSTPL